MRPFFFLFLILGATAAGCDLFRDDPEPEAFGEVTATVNGQPWDAFPRAAVVYTEDVFVPQDDSMLSMQFDAFDLNGFRTGALVMTFPFRGTGSYDIPHTMTGRSDPDSANPALPDTLFPIVAFYDTQHSNINAQLLLEEDDEFEVTIDGFDRERGEIRGTFSGRLVYFAGRRATDPSRNYPDTLRFADGEFESRFEFVSAEDR